MLVRVMKKILPILIAFILTLNSCPAQEEVVLELQKETPFAVSVSDDNLGIKENFVTKKMWLDKIPDVILLNDIKKKYCFIH